MIIETTLFWNEEHYFKERVLHTLTYADLLLISESPDSFSGKISRPLRVPALIASLPAEAQKKVRLVEVDLKPLTAASAEDRDAFVRDSGLRYLEKNSAALNLPVDAVLFATDFDEFTFPKSAHEISLWLNRFPWRSYVHLRQRLTYYFLNYQVVGPGESDWIRPFACRLSWAIKKSLSVHKLRNRRSRKITKDYAGWHHSYLGGKEFILEKVKSFAHADDPAFKGQTEEDRIKNLLAHKDLYSRPMEFKKLQNYAENGIDILKTRKDLFF